MRASASTSAVGCRATSEEYSARRRTSRLTRSQPMATPSPLLVLFLLVTVLPFTGTPPALAAASAADDGAGPARRQRVARAAEALRETLIAQRRDFHMHPEL